ncbi:MAG: ribosomal L7Ae/L30e/S12e/Gadd45 family protein [Clostridiales bacterium]|jgi:ribosomal protein L7Ae-like RNA K-turn-binding protein|nr:ribosomal L7Ae/L30e/S12e/Gadd45 family protein [Clostridiales bacterium]
MLDRKLASLLSLSRRAGKLITGESACENALRDNSAQLVIVCSDASENTKKKFSQKTFYYKVPFFVLSDMESLNSAMGQSGRATFAICDKGFADTIIKLIENL